MGFCTPADVAIFYRQAPEFEEAIVDDGINLFKLWFAVSRKEQRKRMDARRDDPLKRWKLSPMDLESMGKWDEYTIARDKMFLSTHTRLAPWTVIRSDDKRRARINAIRCVLNDLTYPDKDASVACAPDPRIVGAPNPVTSGEYEFVLRRKEP